MSRRRKTIFGVILIAIVFVIGHYITYDLKTGPSAQCINSFNRLDAGSKDMQLKPSEIQSDEKGGISAEDFARADMDNDRNITVQEFCYWTGAAKERG